MATKIAINGFGRIGRCVARALFEGEMGEKQLELKAINDLASAETLAHLYNYDTVHRGAKYKASLDGDQLVIRDKKIQIFSEKDPSKLPWKNLEIDIVFECTGLFTSGEKARLHLEGGARKVLISAPSKGHDKTLVLGVNHKEYDRHSHHIVSNGSCTTNCLAPVAKVLADTFGIEYGLMNTIHSYTNDQAILDVPHRKGDLRRARAAAQNMIPTSTGAAKALAEVIPALKGKLDGQAVRVPTMDVSIVDLTVYTTKSLTKESLHEAMKAASEGPMKGILGFNTLPLVSSDFIGDPRSSIFDSTVTQVMGDRFVKVMSWYDNEWGFSNRMIDMAHFMAGYDLKLMA